MGAAESGFDEGCEGGEAFMKEGCGGGHEVMR